MNTAEVAEALRKWMLSPDGGRPEDPKRRAAVQAAFIASAGWTDRDRIALRDILTPAQQCMAILVIESCSDEHRMALWTLRETLADGRSREELGNTFANYLRQWRCQPDGVRERRLRELAEERPPPK